jgi:hypothetical protein
MKHKILRAFLIIALCLIFSSMTVGYAHADAIMFPWVIKTDTVSTIISVVNTAHGDLLYEERLHFQYWYKIPHPNTNDVNHQRTYVMNMISWLQYLRMTLYHLMLLA